MTSDWPEFEACIREKITHSNQQLEQSGNNQISIGAETDFTLTNGYSDIYHPGLGGNIKGLYGIGTAPQQLMLTADYVTFSGKSSSTYGNQRLSLIPIQAGYRYNLSSGFYGELQAGVGMLGTHADSVTFTQTNFAAAADIGYDYKGLDLSVRYYTEGDVISIFAIRLAYNISLGRNK
jgi:hypothetical protein